MAPESHIGYIVGMKAGLDYFIYREIEELLKRNVQITLFITRLKRNDIYSAKEEWRYFYITKWLLMMKAPFLFLLHPLKNSILLIEALKTGSVVDLVYALAFSQAMKKCKINLIHATSGDHKLFVGYYCKKMLGVPLTMTLHSHGLHHNINPKIFKTALDSCTKIITIANYSKQVLMKNHGIAPGKIAVIKLSVDTDLFSPAAKRKVLTVSRFHIQKGYDILFQAIKLLNRDDVEFIIVGFGSLDLHELARHFGVADRIIVYPKMTPAQLKFFYQNCHVFCLPSRTTEQGGKEGIPVVLMEAMACGMPIVTTNNGAIPELVPEVIVEENNPQALAAGLEQVLRELPDYQQRANGYRRIIEGTHGASNIDALKNELQKVIAGE